MPMYFSSTTDRRFCEAQVGWHIEEGHLDGVDLSGRKVGVWLHAPCEETQRILQMVAGN